jgi:mRNA interferase HigB
MGYSLNMHIISHTKIIEAQKAHPDCRTALEQWYRLTKRVAWENYSDVKGFFPSVDKIGDKFVFDIGGNKLRLIAAIHFNTKKVFVRIVLTHKQYDKGDWK